MTLKKVRTFNLKNQDLSRMQDNLSFAIDTINKVDLLDGILLESVVLTSGSNTVNHTLGRNLKGWYPVRVRAQAYFWDTQDSNTTPQLTLILHTTANVTVDLWVF